MNWFITVGTLSIVAWPASSLLGPSGFLSFPSLSSPPHMQFCSFYKRPKRVVYPCKVTGLSEDCQTYQSTFQCVINIQGPPPHLLGIRFTLKL